MGTRYFSVRIREDIADAVRREVKRNKISASQIFNLALRDYFFNRDKGLVELTKKIDKVKKFISELDNATKTAKN